MSDRIHLERDVAAVAHHLGTDLDELLAQVGTHSGSLTRAAFLSARNDALANVAIIAAGFVTDVGIFVINFDAARQV
jgi:hypothetical protein